jgi:hypothetical protein
MSERQVLRVNADGTRTPVAGLQEIKRGERFELFEQDGTGVEQGVVWMAIDDGYMRGSVGCIACEPYSLPPGAKV